MYRAVFAMCAALLVFVTTACTYESLPERPAPTVNALPTVPPLIPLMSPEEPLPLEGPCSIAEVNRKLQADFIGMVDTDYSMFGGPSFGLDFTPRVELGRGLTLSLPDKTYEFLRMAAPEANRQSTLVMSLTKDSFESLVQGV
ncbi:MAG: hypothetical protein ABWX90_00005, partial [Candidatus Saccharimonadales bacterium]